MNASPPYDRFAHLRANLTTYRALTAQVDSIPWCVSCEVHHAPAPGELCPVCASELAA
jgi:hypothetical protein